MSVLKRMTTRIGSHFNNRDVHDAHPISTVDDMMHRGQPPMYTQSANMLVDPPSPSPSLVALGFGNGPPSDAVPGADVELRDGKVFYGGYQQGSMDYYRSGVSGYGTSRPYKGRPKTAHMDVRMETGEVLKFGGTQDDVIPKPSRPIIPTNHPKPLPRPQVQRPKGTYRLTDFLILRTLGTGSFGRVHLGAFK